MTTKSHDKSQLTQRSPEDSLTLSEQIHRELERSNASSFDLARAESADRGSTILHKELSYAIGGAVIEVHRHLGPGQIEINYERALAYELEERGIPFARQVVVDSYYKGKLVGNLVVDMIVDDKIVLELKSVTEIHQIHRAQLLGYLRATGLHLGLLINFNEAVAWKGIHRIVW